jgi:predicted transposase/invertase (TIGR01784 family)
MEARMEILPTNDMIFKMMFGDPKHSRILIHFLNAVIKPESPIKSVEIIKGELVKERLDEKGVRLDVVARTDKEIINVEMQLKDNRDMVGRALYYWSKLFGTQLYKGEEYIGLRRTVSISILGFEPFKDERYWHTFFIKDKETNEYLTDLLEMHFIELNKMRELDEKSALSFWIEFFKNPYSDKIKPVYKFVPELKEAKEVYEQAKSDPEAQEYMRVMEKAKRDYCSDINSAKNEGKAEGELKAKREAALKMLKKGMTPDEISEFTGLTIEEIKGLKDKS